MEKKYLQIIGCGASQGVPTADGNWGNCKKNKKNIRKRSSVFIKYNNIRILLDTSPDLRFQLLDNNISDLDCVFFTHSHADHIFGINELRSFYIKKKQKINIYSTKECILSLQKIFSYLFKSSNHYPSILRKNIIKKSIVIKKNKQKIIIEKLDVTHGKTKTIGYKINNQVAYIPDCKIIPQKTINKIHGIEYLIIDCFRIKKHNLHINLNESIKYIEKIKPKKAFLTHMSKDFDYKVLKKRLKKYKIIQPSFDGMKIALS